MLKEIEDLQAQKVTRDHEDPVADKDLPVLPDHPEKKETPEEWALISKENEEKKVNEAHQEQTENSDRYKVRKVAPPKSLPGTLERTEYRAVVDKREKKEAVEWTALMAIRV